MALVVLLRGVNVGGHRAFRPAELARQLSHLGAINIGAAGTFVIPRNITRARLRDEFAQRLPFNTSISIVAGRDIAKMAYGNRFANAVLPPDTVRFVSFLCARPRSWPRLPVQFPAKGRWLVRMVARDRRFVAGLYRRHMKTIGYLGRVDQLFGVPATTRNWNTILAIAAVLEQRTKLRI
jgi:uncharacterized protein (DUF1697 family)